MRQVKLFSVAVMAVLSLIGAMAAIASAEATMPSILPEGNAAAPLLATTSCTTKNTLADGVSKIESTQCKGSQAGNSKKLGTFDTLFETTTLGTEPCTGLNDTKEGSVLVTGTFHIRHYNQGAPLRTAEIFLLKEVHFECGVEPILFDVKGCVAAELTPNEEKLVTLLTLNFTMKEGDNVPVKVLSEESTGEENCELLAKEGAGIFRLSTQVTTVDVAGFKKGGANATVLVMPL